MNVSPNLINRLDQKDREKIMHTILQTCGLRIVNDEENIVADVEYKEVNT